MWTELHLTLCTIFMLSTISAMPVTEKTVETYYRFDNLSYAIDSILHLLPFEDKKEQYYFLLGDDLNAISGLSVFYPKKEDGSYNTSAYSLSASWTHHRVVKQGTEWGPWKPGSCVHQNGMGATPIEISTKKASSVSPQVKPGFNLEFGHKVAKLSGYVTTEKNSDTDLRTYTVPERSHGQIWQQQFMVWQEQESRKCLQIFLHGPEVCGVWSDAVRGDLPIMDHVSFGWSTGWDKMDFSSCGGN